MTDWSEPERRMSYNAEDADEPQASPERKLLVAILERAFNDLSPRLKQTGDSVYNRDQTIAWIYEEFASQQRREFGFKWLCYEIGLDYDFLIETLQSGQRIPEFGEAALIIEKNSPVQLCADGEHIYFEPQVRRWTPRAPSQEPREVKPPAGKRLMGLAPDLRGIKRA